MIRNVPKFDAEFNLDMKRLCYLRAKGTDKHGVYRVLESPRFYEDASEDTKKAIAKEFRELCKKQLT